ncbi:MAG: UvrD-helicase domain-containing protein [Psychrilyobacter sp.]|uniref:UvrD-helicase domain-containing protein n=1 Tax=Psychrilyobacter sp. TaxID=2586924 RepID=UPI003C76E2A1
MNKEQEKIAYTKPNGHMLIKGIAGSGKTTVGICRISYLLNNYCHDKDDNILFITFNKTLVNYVSYFYNKVDNITQYNMHSLFGFPKDRVKITTVDSLMYGYFLEYQKKSKTDLKLNPTNHKKHGILNELIEKLKGKYSEVSIFEDVNTAFLLEEINWIKACNYIDEAEYQEASRIGSLKLGVTTQKLPKNSIVRKAIFELMELYTENLLKENIIDYNDMRLIALGELGNKIKKKYTHILIDECQDLSKVQLEFIRGLYANKSHSSFTFLFDSAQSIYSHSWLGMGGERTFASIGFNMIGKSKTLSKNFRTTTQISKAAYSLLNKNEVITGNSDYVKPYLIDRYGNYPIFKEFLSEREQATYVKKLLDGRLSKTLKSDIAIIGRTKNQLLNFKLLMEKLGVQTTFIDRGNDDFDSNEIKLFTMHSIKGIETKIIIMISLNEKILPFHSSNIEELKEYEEIQERKLMYVGMTRAIEELYLLSSGTPSKFIGDIGYKFLQIDTDKKMRIFYNIPVDDYYFKDQLIDHHSNEEKVRQWLIKELISTYEYRLELIDIEYSLTFGSKKYFVDIVIYNKKKPYIFIETKSKEVELLDGFEQLKSYMIMEKSVEYGILTNGRDIKIYNSEFYEVSEIPEFTLDMVEEVVGEEFIYSNLKKNSEIPYLVIDEDTIIAEDKDGDVTYNKRDLISLPKFKWVNMYTDYEGQKEKILLPKEWVSENYSYIIENCSDSMVPLICDGDLVVVEKRSPKTNDIIAVIMEEKSVLKRYMKIGTSILLSSENEDYEPIYFNEQDINDYFVGVAVGVIK